MRENEQALDTADTDEKFVRICLGQFVALAAIINMAGSIDIGQENNTNEFGLPGNMLP